MALKKGDWGKALGYLSRAEKLSSGLPDIHNLVEQARQNYWRTPEGQSDYVTLEALYAQAQQYLAQHNLDRAASLLERIVRMDAGYQNTYELALETRAQADKEKAEQEKQVKLTELYGQAQAYIKDENWAGAVDTLTQLVEIDEDYPDAQQLLNEATKQKDLQEAYQAGERHFKKSEWAKAVAAFGKVASIEETYQDVAKLLALSRHQKQLDAWIREAEDYLNEGDWEAAIEILADNQVAKEREAAKLALNYAYARFYRQQRDWAQMAMHLKEVLEARPNYRPDLDELYQEATEELHWQQQFEKAITHIELNEWPAAKATLESIVQAKADYPMAQERLQQVNEEIRLADRYKKAQDALEFKQWAKAIPFLKEIIHYKDASVFLTEALKQLELAAFFRDGLEAAGSGRWSEAISAFEHVVEIEPDHQEALTQLQNARDKVTLEHSFNQGMHAFELGQQHYDLERLNEAVDYLETVAKIDQRYRGVTNRLREAKREQFLLQNYLQGAAAFENEQWAEAIKYWQVIVKDENEPDYHGDSARRLAQAKHQQRLANLYLEANQHFRAAEWANAIMLLEELQQETGDEDYRDAASLLGEAKLQQELLNHYQQAEQLFAAEQWDKVVQHLEQIQAKRANYHQTDVERMLEDAQTNREATRNYEAGLEALKAERWADAVICFDKTFSLRSGFRDVSTRLRQARQQQTLHERYQAVLELMDKEAWEQAIEHLVAIQGLDPDFKDARQKLDEAERQKQLAADYQTALAYFEAERWTEARNSFTSILARQKDYKEAQARRNEAQQQLDMAAKYAQAIEKIERAKDQPENWQLAVDELTPVVAWQPDYHDTQARLAEAQHQAHLYGLYQRATVLGVKDEITDLEKAIELLGQITKIDLNYRDAAPLKGRYEAVLRKKKQGRIKAHYDNAMLFAGTGNFDQVLSLLEQMIPLDKRYQSVRDKIDGLIKQCLEKYQRGLQLKADRKTERQAVTLLQEYQRDKAQLPAAIQGILRQNPPK